MSKRMNWGRLSKSGKPTEEKYEHGKVLNNGRIVLHRKDELSSVDAKRPYQPTPYDIERSKKLDSNDVVKDATEGRGVRQQRTIVRNKDGTIKSATPWTDY